MTPDRIHDVAGRERVATRALTRDDVEYPAHLRGLPDAPDTLHVRGALAERDALAIAVVGSRRATP